jgi:hypothetical protein
MCYKKCIMTINNFFRGRQRTKRLCIARIHIRMRQAKTDVSIKQKMRWHICFLVDHFVHDILL